jgi:N-acetylneuraminate synthase/N,N'-diacetyllegionaminate synthase
MEKNNFIGKNGPLLIAEIGGNHEGSFNYAKKLVNLAIKSDVDSIKLQLYSGLSLVSPIESKKRYEHFKKFELSKKEHIYLAEMCQSNKVKYIASVWNLEMLNWIDKYLDYYKIGSGDLTAYPIIKEFALRGKPIILSTGLSSIIEVNKTVRYIQKLNSKYKKKEYLAILQCTSCYPTKDFDVNLNCIDTIKEKTKMTVGYSDHSLGSLALKAAYAKGAEILEFHFTDTRVGKKFRDHKISLNLKETKSLIKDLCRIKFFMGSKEKKPTINEIQSGHHISFRRGVYVNKNLKIGHIIKLSDLVFLRPNHGVDVRDFEKLIGKKTISKIIPYKKLIIKNGYIKN